MDSFRRELAGLLDPAGTEGTSDAYKDCGLRLCLAMAELFGDELDRKTLWKRIESGLRAASSKQPAGGDSLINAAVEHVMADPGLAAANDAFSELIVEVDNQTDAWNRGWAAYLNRHSVVLVAQARVRWRKRKEQS